MLPLKLALIDEQTSPLFRIMALWDVDNVNRRKAVFNICAFHIGSGIQISVDHVLSRAESLLFSISDAIYQRDIHPLLNPAEQANFNNAYVFDQNTQKHYLNSTDENVVNNTKDSLKRIGFNLTVGALYTKGICTPYLVVQFEQNQFYNDAALTASYPAHLAFHEPQINKYTFLIELELIDSSIEFDIAIFKVVAAQSNLVPSMPTIEVSYNQLDSSGTSIFCLQNSPSGTNCGRLLNDASISGLMDHHVSFQVSTGLTQTRHGLRYLISGYFRFGSSGAPYLKYNAEEERFEVFAIQSEAGGIQMDINSKREGNTQWTKGIATPLFHVEEVIRNALAL